MEPSRMTLYRFGNASVVIDIYLDLTGSSERPPSCLNCVAYMQVSQSSEESVDCSSPGKQITQSIHPPPAFGSAPNLEALALEASGNNSVNSHTDIPR
ncbi:unnamed protein product [Lactuca virosa]|uniref:Uncharacterized protein n=1 Tax=Lactuca virosa TaxID=75947 RepID=A0AAU9PH61_9ASTR|nr:unnamed protein product [Lactuca virosa]